MAAETFILRARRLFKLAIVELLYRSGGFQTGRRGNAVCVLGLHRVLTESEKSGAHSLPGMVMSEEVFSQLLQFAAREFEVVPFTDLSRQPESASARPCLVITFDDGWRDNFTTAFGPLRRSGLPAAIFLATGTVGSQDTFWVEKLVRSWQDSEQRAMIVRDLAGLGDYDGGADLENLVEFLKHHSAKDRASLLAKWIAGEFQNCVPGDRMMDWTEATEMFGAGIAFGSHTVTHPLLTFEDELAVERELRDSKQEIEHKLGGQAVGFAYPNGDFNTAVRAQVVLQGYRMAFTTLRGWFQPGDDLFTIRRFLLHDGNVTGLRGKFSPAMFWYTVSRRD